MFNFFNRITLSRTFVLIILMFYFCIIVLGLFSRWNWVPLVFGGKYYNKAIENLKFSSDLDPDKLNMDQYFLLSFLIVNEKDPHQLNILIDRVETLNRDFEIRVQELLTTFSNQSYEEHLHKSIFLMREFFKVFYTQFIPEITKEDREKARGLLNGAIKELYLEQSEVNQQLIDSLNEKNKELEKEISYNFVLGRLLTFGFLLTSAMITGLFVLRIGRSITNRLSTALVQIGSVSKEVNFHMDQQAQSIAQQSQLVNQTTSSMNELNHSFHHTTVLAQESSKCAENALKISGEGNSLIKQMLEEMMDHKEKVLAILNQILHLNEVVNRIHSIASSINNLTNQTNILALNAAVQAAHVKENGEGFSVIASEIRKLADESKKFVSHIDQLTENIQHATDSTIRIAQEGSQSVQESIKLAQSSSKAFDTVISISTHSFEGAREVCVNIEKQTGAVYQVLEAMKVLSEAASQSLNDMKKVKGEIEKLDELSQDLKIIV